MIFSSPDVALDNADLPISNQYELNWYSFIPSGEAAYAPDDARPATAHTPIAAFTNKRRTLVMGCALLGFPGSQLVWRYCRRAWPLHCAKVLMPADKWPRSSRTQPRKVNHKASLRSRMRSVGTFRPISVWRMARGVAGAVLLLGGICAAPAPAAAHQVNISTARVEVRPDRVVAVEIALKGSDVDRLAGTHVFDEQSGTVDAAKV